MNPTFLAELKKRYRASLFPVFDAMSPNLTFLVESAIDEFISGVLKETLSADITLESDMDREFFIRTMGDILIVSMDNNIKQLYSFIIASVVRHFDDKADRELAAEGISYN